MAIEVKLGFDVDLSGFNRFESTLKRVGTEIHSFRVRGVDGFSRVVSEGAKLTIPARAVDQLSNSLKRVVTPAASANTAMIGFSRVVQDLPYGLIGIINNLQELPILLSRLKKEAAETGTTIGRQLLASLRGGGGLILGFSLLTTGLQLATLGFSSFTRGLGRTKKDIDDLSQSIRSIPEINIEAKGSVGGEIAKVQALSNAVLDLNKSYTDRQRALEQLKKTNQSYFGDLTLEADKLKILKDRVEEYSKAIIAEATIKEFSQELGKLNKLIIENELATSKAELNYDLQIRKNTDALKKRQEEIARGQGREETLEATISAGNTTLQRRVRELTNNKEAGAKLKTQYDELFDAMQKVVNESLKFLPLSSPSIKIKPEKIELDRSAFDFGIDEATVRVERLNLAPAEVRLSGENADIGDAINEAIGSDISIPEIRVPVVIDQKKLEQITTIADSLANAFSNVFNEIAQGRSVLQSIGNAIQQVVTQLIQAAIRALIFRAILTASGVGAAPGGFSIGSALSRRGGFAKGGIVPPGYPNDTYPALLSSHEVVLNPGQLAAMKKSDGGDKILVTELSGDVLRLWLQRSNNKAGRSFF